MEIAALFLRGIQAQSEGCVHSAVQSMTGLDNLAITYLEEEFPGKYDALYNFWHVAKTQDGFMAKRDTWDRWDLHSKSITDLVDKMKRRGQYAPNYE